MIPIRIGQISAITWSEKCGSVLSIRFTKLQNLCTAHIIRITKLNWTVRNFQNFDFRLNYKWSSFFRIHNCADLSNPNTDVYIQSDYMPANKQQANQSAHRSSITMQFVEEKNNELATTKITVCHKKNRRKCGKTQTLPFHFMHVLLLLFFFIRHFCTKQLPKHKLIVIGSVCIYGYINWC